MSGPLLRGRQDLLGGSFIGEERDILIEIGSGE